MHLKGPRSAPIPSVRLNDYSRAAIAWHRCEVLNREHAAHTLQTVGEAVAAREEEERGNAMKALENRTLDSKKEMDIMDALEELIVSAASPAQHCRRHRWLRTSCHMEVMAQHRREHR